MAHFYAQQSMAPQDAITSQYSVLHQERLYLLNVLTDEENQGERLTQSLVALQAQITQNEAAEPPLNTKRLRQQVKIIRHKLVACQQREHALAANLANVAAQLEGMKRYQWRSAQHEYTMQIQQAQQHAQLVLMSPSRPNFALRSPANVDIAAQMQYMSLNPPTVPSYDLSMFSPYANNFTQPSVMSSFNVPYTEYANGQTYADTSHMQRSLENWAGFVESPVSAMKNSSPVSAMSPLETSPTAQDQAPARKQSRSHRRAAGMLATVHEHRYSSTGDKSDHRPAMNGALRRLSLLDGSAALKVEREAAEARAQMVLNGSH